MVNRLPTVLIGGPPHTGKSVLTYSLTQALRKQHIEHYVIRACPDGEGDWSQEIHQDTVRLIRIKGTWTDSFVKLICRDLERRHLPLLVDVGGLPKDEQLSILRGCTHSLLLLHQNDTESAAFWRHLVEDSGLQPLAVLYSEPGGTSQITSETPVIEGTIAGLERGISASGPVFDLIVTRLVSLFNYSPEELKKVKLKLAPTELVADVEQLLGSIAPDAHEWEPDMLLRLPTELPLNVPLSAYGRGPNWLYGALAMHADKQPFYQFDPRLGWITPPPLLLSAQTAPEVSVQLCEFEDVTVLSVRIVNDYLDYSQAENLPFPPVPIDRGLILDGRSPHWLLTALVRLYDRAGVVWIACHQPQVKGAVVVVSHTPSHTPGDLISMPIFESSSS